MSDDAKLTSYHIKSGFIVVRTTEHLRTDGYPSKHIDVEHLHTFYDENVALEHIHALEDGDARARRLAGRGMKEDPHSEDAALKRHEEAQALTRETRHPKPCCDCKYFASVTIGTIRHSECRHPEVAFPCVVHGTGYPEASNARGRRNCGEEGKNWESSEVERRSLLRQYEEIKAETAAEFDKRMQL